MPESAVRHEAEVRDPLQGTCEPDQHVGSRQVRDEERVEAVLGVPAQSEREGEDVAEQADKAEAPGGQGGQRELDNGRYGPSRAAVVRHCVGNPGREVLARRSVHPLGRRIRTPRRREGSAERARDARGQ